MSTQRRIDVEIWSDVVCPWCYIGKRRFEKALTMFGAAHPDVAVDVAYRAFMLDPSAPAGVSQPVVAVYERKFGGPEQAAAIIDRLTTEAASEGLDFRLDIAKRSNTFAAHRLLALAEREGVQLDLKERLLAAYFTEGAAIGDKSTLVALAEEVGLDGDACRQWLAGDGGRNDVDDHLEYAAANFLTGVPTYVVDRATRVEGAQAPETFLHVLERRLISTPEPAE